jgi:hypothetical protein
MTEAPTDDVPDFFVDNGHIRICGITGSKTEMGGKTALANYWASTFGTRWFDLVIFFNAKGTTTVHGERVYSVEELAERMREGVRHFDLVPETEDWAAYHARLKDFVAALPTEMSKMVVHDEVPDYGDEGSLSSFVKVLGQDDGLHAGNCKSICLAQSPTTDDVPSVVGKQTDTFVWVGPISDDYRAWFRQQGWSNHFDHIVETHDPYYWTVIQGTRDEDRVTFDPVPEDFA